MRLLFTIPHYFASSASGNYGSERNTAESRSLVIRRCLASLVQTFSAAQGLMNGRDRELHPANPRYAADITIAVCTTGDRHLVPELDGSGFTHIATNVEPRHLGFECHKVLRDGLGAYDFFGYLEDDLQIADGLFFAKLGWFNTAMGEQAVLQPNRFELIDDPVPYKLYIDGNLHAGAISDVDQNLNAYRRVDMPALGQGVIFQRVGNPHSGCFFLNAAQMARWAGQADFGMPSAAFGGPLESAATLGLMRHFRVYKPARENAAFLEIEHLDPRYLGRHFWPEPGNPPRLRWE
ncbi:MAG: calcium-binding protein [Alphaproteobacteria bacterium]|nr:calcium-binding protein [Alphaproteobacteria bacterium]